MKNKISVVVPVYNVEQFIERCVKSILSQTYTNIELILVDDGSIDSSGKIIDELSRKHPNIKTIHKNNGGVTSARLDGVRIASGEWIGFIDGDDFIEPDMYERLIYNAKKYNAQVSHCGYQMVFPSRVDYYYNTGRFVQQDNLTGLKDLLSGSFIEPGLCNKIFHKTLFRSLLQPERVDLSIKNNEDLLMNYFLFKESSNSVYEDFCPYHYIVRTGSAANSDITVNVLLDPLKVRKIILNDAKNSEIIQIMDRSVLNLLITLSTVKYNDKSIKIDCIYPARKELRKGLKKYLFGSFSLKQKVSALWVSIWPASYRWVHEGYMKITGLDKQYEVS